MNSAILLAGGIGSRFGSSTPKQFVSLKGKLLILHSFEKLVKSLYIDEIIIVCQKKYEKLFECEKILKFARPGQERQQSVYNGLKLATGDYVVVHDGARPLFSLKSMEKAIEAAKQNGASALAVPVTSTIKKWDRSIKTVPRKNLWEIQTPQVVRRSLFIKAFQFVIQNKVVVTDDLSVVEAFGHQPTLVEGNDENIKITRPIDLKVAGALYDSL
ncbi:MAG: 2-C-methyl-D-erythritol 4-phosphate cytidylyltransferase [Rhabdochlamydiaceae bacterium]|nr:2-C-methyl-D-erythritol 4-phosphate cytidylyltransferase [Candidatus Amphrikana amoebophyrae]